MKVSPEIEAKIMQLAGKITPAKAVPLESLEVEISLPPSANQIWRQAGKRQYRSRRYSDWLAKVVPYLASHFQEFTGLVSVSITILGGKGFSQRCDIDNRIKPIMDALKHAKRIVDDSIKCVKKIQIEYQEPQSKKSVASCIVTIKPV